MQCAQYARCQRSLKNQIQDQKGTKLALPFEPEDARTKNIQSQSVG